MAKRVLDNSIRILSGVLLVFLEMSFVLHRAEGKDLVNLVSSQRGDSTSLTLNGVTIDMTVASQDRFNFKNSLGSTGGSRSGHALAQFTKPQSPQDRQRIEMTGVRFLQYVPKNAYFLAGTHAALDLLSRSERVVGLVPIPSVAKIGESIRPRTHAAVNTHMKSAKMRRFVHVQVVFFEDVSYKDARAVLLAHGVVLEPTRTNFDFRHTLDKVILPAFRVPLLAEEDSVALLAEVKPPYNQANINAQDTSNVDDIQPGGIPGYNLDGTAVTVGVWDVGRVRTTHEQIIGRAIQQDTSVSTFSDHATHVAGTIAGSGAGKPEAKGMAPNATLLCWRCRGDLASVDTNAHRISVSNHSYVSSLESNFASDENTHKIVSSFSRNYSTKSQGWDKIVQDHDLIVVMSAGNRRRAVENTSTASKRANESEKSRSASAKDYSQGYGTILSSAVAKDLIAVGAIHDLTEELPFPEDDSMTTFSCWGPSDDGRIKPDVVANGVRVLSMAAEADDAYTVNSGTSMASAVTTGAIACLLQQFRNHFGKFDPPAALMKAIVIHTARDGGSIQGPDYRFGWGLVDARAAADFIRESARGEELIDLDSFTDSALEYSMVKVRAGPAKCTLVWTDPPGIAHLAGTDTPNLVNDLDLSVLGPDRVHYPWTLDPSKPTLPARQDFENHRDNVEQVFFDSAVPGVYTIRIDGQVNLGDRQRFALCVTGLRFADDKPHAVVFAPSNTKPLRGTVPFRVHTTASHAISSMVFRVDGQIIENKVLDVVEGGIMLGAADSAERHYIAWETSTVSDGRHTVDVTVTDTQGLTCSKSMQVLIINDTDVLPLRDGASEVSEIWPTGDIDWYSFQITVPGLYTIETHPVPDETIRDTVLTLYGPDTQETELAQNDDGGVWLCSKIAHVLQADRTYYVKVEGNAGATGAYSLNVRTGGEKQLPVIVSLPVNGPMISSMLAGWGVTHWYSFQTSAFGRYRFWTSRENNYPGVLPRLSLYEKEGGPVLARSPSRHVLQAQRTYLLNAIVTDRSAKIYSVGVETKAGGSLVPLLLDGPATIGHLSSGSVEEQWYSINEPGFDGYAFIEVKPVSLENRNLRGGPVITLHGPDDPNKKSHSPETASFGPQASSRLIASLRAEHTYFAMVTPHARWSGAYSINVRRASIESLFTISRSFSSARYRPGQTLSVVLTVLSDSDSYIRYEDIVEVIPSGWTPRNISHGGRFDAANGTIRWFRIPPPGERFLLSYEIVVPESAKGTHRFELECSYKVGDETYEAIVIGEKYLSERVNTAVENWTQY